MKATFSDADELVRERGGRWTLVARHPLLRIFFQSGGDYEFLARHPDVLTTSTGGNEVNWDVDDGEVVLSHQIIDVPPCRIRAEALLTSVARLASARGVSQPARPASSKGKAAKKKARAFAKGLETGVQAVPIKVNVKAIPIKATTRTQ